MSDLKARLAANPQDMAARQGALRLCLVDLASQAVIAEVLDGDSIGR